MGKKKIEVKRMTLRRPGIQEIPEDSRTHK